MPKSQCNVAITGPMLYDVKACVICAKFATFVTALNQLIIFSNYVSVEALAAKCLNSPFTSKIMSSIIVACECRYLNATKIRSLCENDLTQCSWVWYFSFLVHAKLTGAG